HPAADWLFMFTTHARTSLSPLSLHDALPISSVGQDRVEIRTADDAATMAQLRDAFDLEPTTAERAVRFYVANGDRFIPRLFAELDRKSTRLNSSHQIISYAVFCLKKKRTQRA